MMAGCNERVQAQTGKPVALKRHLTAAQHDDALKSGILYTNYVRLGAPVRLLRFIVLDSLSGATGSVTVPVEKIN
jgi:hypothetical protein